LDPCCEDRITGIIVYVADGPFETICTSHPSSTLGIAVIKMPCNGVVIGDRIKLVLPGLTILSMCEVKAYGYEI